MIDLYSWPTPNGQKVHIALEELGIPYRAHGVNIGRGDQFEPDFLAISPNNKIPAIVDDDGPNGGRFPLFESGAILLYLAERGGGLLPRDAPGHHRAMEWLMFQMGNLGPMLGQAHHFRQYAPETIDYAVNRYTREAARLYGVMDSRLERHAYLAGDDYTVADVACFPWIRSHANQGQTLADFPYLQRWFEAIAARPAVQRGLEVLQEQRGEMDDEAKRYLFGDVQYQRH